MNSEYAEHDGHRFFRVQFPGILLRLLQSTKQ